MDNSPSRRELLRCLAAAASWSALPRPLSAQQGVQHTLWVVDRIGSTHLVGQQLQTVLGAVSVLNLAFMAPLVSNPLADRITAQLSAAPNFTPGDAVVFLVSSRDPRKLPVRLRPTGPETLGRSVFDPGAPSTCVVFWEHCFNDLEVAGALFHEAAHGMSQQEEGMHTYRSPGVGGAGVRVLAPLQQGHPQLPSYADLEFYLSAIRQRTPFATRWP